MSSRTPIRDLMLMISVDQITVYFSDFKHYEILKQVQDDTEAFFSHSMCYCYF
jgi:hypothetical protein